MSKFSFCYLISLLLIFILVVPGFGQTRVGKLGVGVDGSMQYIFGAGNVNTSPAIGYGLNMSYSIMEGLGIRSKIAYNQLSWKASTGASATTDLMSLNFYLSGDLMPNSPFNIFVLGGGGFAFYDPKQPDGSHTTGISSFDVHYIGGLGADYFLSEFWSITLMGEYVLTNSKYYNGPLSSDNDSFLRGSIQIRYHFFDQSFITKLLEAEHERSKQSK
ncbi:MAG: outer membrane beta-barrel protein [Bacteroidota bacterium]